ncbi:MULTISPECIES: RHS repeat-associated core domain-containing protein [Sorangium]|uniref:Tox-REase-7 domain-containing protein n=1 Tax=Sorangium cellulosum TaxID=56 RepID=A0A4P2QY47_SORCE|nr:MULTISPECIES: RHS repeat-associated core domain-containing protein [Sorangium]AUX35469.1 uncharacterized protein SOCE836_076610 [Sorangium cellulosum]WCQ94773.1 hypothetical protein NQZ70_07542 [Sorangium sp. Soce836]
MLKNLRYVYDPVGNIVEIGDSAQQTVFFNNDVVSPSAQYVYDAVYRLIEATGREHAGGLSDAPRDQNDLPIQSLPHPNDPQALRNYTEQYVYDAVGNLLRMVHQWVHQAGLGSWTRWYAYETANNRLTSTTGDPEHGPFRTYAHDAHGNMTSMPHITALTWDENDQVRSTDLGGGGDVYYDYDAAGQRVRKVWEHSGLVEERIYLGGYEVYRRRNSSGLELERQTLHVMDGARRVAMVETKTVDTAGPFTVTPRVRYQLDNHLGSASLEVDGAGLVIGYEEYHPYGTTAYWSAASGIEVSQRRYRYTGKEKDEETGLYYHGARYYAPWLGRWTSADPAGMVDGPNLYEYVRGSPARLRDPSGTQGDEPNYGLEALQRINEVNAAQLGVPSATPEEQKARRKHAAEAATARAEAAKEAALRARATPATKEERWEAAKTGIKHDVTESAGHALLASALLPAGPVLFLGSLFVDLSGLHGEAPSAGAEGLRKFQLEDNYETGRAISQTVQAGAAFVPWSEIAAGARTAAGKLPELYGLGAGGGGKVVTFSERFAAEAAAETGAAARVAPRTFTSTDPQVGELATEIERRVPGIVEDVNIKTMRPNGLPGTDLDIALTDGRVIQIKTGNTKGLTTQMEETAARGWDPIAYAPNASRALQTQFAQRWWPLATTPENLYDIVKAGPRPSHWIQKP